MGMAGVGESVDGEMETTILEQQQKNIKKKKKRRGESHTQGEGHVKTEAKMA